MAEPTERIAILLELEQQQFEKRAKSAGAAIDRLERKFTPLAAAEAKLEKQQLRFNAALEAGTIDAAQHAKGMDLVQREYDQTSERAKRLTSNVVAMNSSVAAQTGFMTRNRSVFQQAGYQIGDFAVQVQGGQSALVAFSQQGSQLLGVFGPWGAVMGAALAVGSSLAGVLWQMGDATEETKEKAKTFADRVGEADAALSAMSATAANVSDLEGLRKKYGELTEEVQQMALALFEIDKREAVAKVSGIITEVTAEIAKAAESTAGTVSAALASAGTDAGKAEAEAYRLEIEKIAGIIADRQAAGQFVDPIDIENLRVMREELAAMQGDFANIGSLVDEINISPDLLRQISEAQAGLEAARNAGDFSEMAAQLGEIRDLLVEAGDTVSQDVLDGVTNAEAVAREMAARLEEGEVAAEGIASVDMASGISPAVEEARKLAENFGIALSLARQLVANAAAANGAGRGRGGDPRKFGGSASDIQTNNLGAQLAYQPGGSAGIPLPKIKGARGGGGSKGGGRSGGGREQEPLFSIAEDELQKLQQSIDMLGKSKGEVAALTVKHKLLDEAKKRGLTITEELTAKIDAEAANVGKLAEQYDQARDRIAAMEKIQGEWKDSVIDAAMGGKDAMDQFTNSIKRAALEYIFFGKGMLAGGGKKGSGFGGLLGGLIGGGGTRGKGLLGMGGFLGFLDAGGSIGAGQKAIVSEKRDELVNGILVRGPAKVTGGAQTARIMNQGGGTQNINLRIHAADGVTVEQVGQIAAGVSVQVMRSGMKKSREALPRQLTDTQMRGV